MYLTQKQPAIAARYFEMAAQCKANFLGGWKHAALYPLLKNLLVALERAESWEKLEEWCRRTMEVGRCQRDGESRVFLLSKMIAAHRGLDRTHQTEALLTELMILCDDQSQRIPGSSALAVSTRCKLAAYFWQKRGDLVKAEEYLQAAETIAAIHLEPDSKTMQQLVSVRKIFQTEKEKLGDSNQPSAPSSPSFVLAPAPLGKNRRFASVS